MRLRPDVQLDQIVTVLQARIDYLTASALLRHSRFRNAAPATILASEGCVLAALDRLWEAQQRAA